MSGGDVSQKEANKSRVNKNTYSRVNFIDAEARIQIREWCD